MKRWFAMILAMVMLLSAFPVGVFAEESGEATLQVPDTQKTERQYVVVSNDGSSQVVAENDADMQAMKREILEKAEQEALAKVELQPTQAIDHGNVIASGQCGENVNWYINDEGTMYISGTGAMWDFRDDASWFDYHPCPYSAYQMDVKSLYFEEGITYIGSNAFVWYPNMKTVHFATSIVEIAPFAFIDCRSLQNFTLPANLQSIGQQCFDGCSSLTEIHFPGTILFFDEPCSRCTNLKLATFGAGPKEWGSFMYADNNPFLGCTALEEIQVDPENIMFMMRDGILYSHDGYKNPVMLMCYPVMKTGSAYTIQEGTTGIAYEAFEDAKVSKVTLPSSMTAVSTLAFGWCTSLTEVVLPDSIIELQNQCFVCCDNLKRLVLPDHLLAIDMGALIGCRSLESVMIPKSVIIIDYGAFSDCRSLKNVYYTGTKTQWNAINIGDENECLTNAKRFYNYTQDLEAPVVAGTHDAATGKNKLTWNAVPYAAEYQVYRATSKTGSYTLMKTTTGCSYINTSAEPGKTYYYKVRAVDAFGTTSSYSAVKTLTCDLAQPVVKATNVASTGYNKLTWEPIEGATAYKVYRSTSRSGTYTLMKTVRDGATSYVNSNAVAGTTYYYYVVAVMDGCSAADSAKSEIKISTCDLARPTVTLTAGTGKITVKWDRVEKATGYKIYRATSKDGTYALVKTITSGDTVSWSNTGLTAGKKYYYKMVAILDGKEAATSAYSTVKYTTVK